MKKIKILTILMTSSMILVGCNENKVSTTSSISSEDLSSNVTSSNSNSSTSSEQVVYKNVNKKGKVGLYANLGTIGNIIFGESGPISFHAPLDVNYTLADGKIDLSNNFNLSVDPSKGFAYKNGDTEVSEADAALENVKSIGKIYGIPDSQLFGLMVAPMLPASARDALNNLPSEYSYARKHFATYKDLTKETISQASEPISYTKIGNKNYYSVTSNSDKLAANNSYSALRAFSYSESSSSTSIDIKSLVAMISNFLSSVDLDKIDILGLLNNILPDFDVDLGTVPGASTLSTLLYVLADGLHISKKTETKDDGVYTTYSLALNDTAKQKINQIIANLLNSLLASAGEMASFVKGMLPNSLGNLSLSATFYTDTTTSLSNFNFDLGLLGESDETSMNISLGLDLDNTETELSNDYFVTLGKQMDTYTTIDNQFEEIYSLLKKYNNFNAKNSENYVSYSENYSNVDLNNLEAYASDISKVKELISNANNDVKYMLGDIDLSKDYKALDEANIDKIKKAVAAIKLPEGGLTPDNIAETFAPKSTGLVPLPLLPDHVNLVDLQNFQAGLAKLGRTDIVDSLKTFDSDALNKWNEYKKTFDNDAKALSNKEVTLEQIKAFNDFATNTDKYPYGKAEVSSYEKYLSADTAKKVNDIISTTNNSRYLSDLAIGISNYLGGKKVEVKEFSSKLENAKSYLDILFEDTTKIDSIKASTTFDDDVSLNISLSLKDFASQLNSQAKELFKLDVNNAEQEEKIKDGIASLKDKISLVENLTKLYTTYEADQFTSETTQIVSGLEQYITYGKTSTSK